MMGEWPVPGEPQPTSAERSADGWTPRRPVDGPGVLGGHASAVLAEADRMMTICNACRYCEGLCAVFPAMERRRVFADGDLEFLASLCHNCGACLYDCQYAPPHEFAVGVPANLAELRTETWERYAWPAPLATAFRRNGAVIAAAIVVAVIGFVAVVAVSLGDGFFASYTGSGAFYEVVPHDTIVIVFVAALAYGLVALGVSLLRFWRAVGGGRPSLAAFAGAGRSASTLEYLDGGGVGCMNVDEHPDDNRRLYHHATYYGFAACLASTTLAAILDTGFGLHAPYPVYHPVVLLGIVGGIGLLVGPAGLFAAKQRRDVDLTDPGAKPMELAFLAMLALLAATGFTVLIFRATSAMPILLAVHLGVVFAFFVTIPYGKFVHGFYRYFALVRNRHEEAVASSAHP